MPSQNHSQNSGMESLFEELLNFRKQFAMYLLQSQLGGRNFNTMLQDGQNSKNGQGGNFNTILQEGSNFNNTGPDNGDPNYWWNSVLEHLNNQNPTKPMTTNSPMKGDIVILKDGSRGMLDYFENGNIRLTNGMTLPENQIQNFLKNTMTQNNNSNQLMNINQLAPLLRGKL